MNNNELFSKLKGSQLDDLIEASLNSDYIYSTDINLPDNLTFGLEIEYETTDTHDNDDIKNEIELNASDWRYKFDGSLHNGGEIVSPILTDTKENWIQLKKICDYLKNKNVIINKHAAAHVHIGANIIGENYIKWIEFAKLYMYFENIIFRYSFGESLNARKKMKLFSAPIAERLYEIFYYFGKIDSFKKFISELPHSRFFSLNFCNMIQTDNYTEMVNGNTIEFRSPNGTINENIWQNNVKTFASMLLAVINDKVDTEYIDHQIKSEEVFFNKNFYYNDIYLKKALEFVDIIFNNNDDKMMFLKQYIKDKTYVKI